MVPELNPGRLALARALAVDGAAAEVVAALRDEGIDPILIKGKTLADWLYPDEVRSYGDADLLVAPARVLDAAAVLQRLDFAPVPQHVSPHAHPWTRPDGTQVDLHARLFGLRCTPDHAWEELQRWREVDRIAGVPVRVLIRPARALQIVLHAVQHLEEPKPREDLRRALAMTNEEIWRQTELLADRLEALHILAHGLALDPAGRQLIERLPLVQAAWLSDQLHAPLAVGLARLKQASGPRAKLAVVRRELALPDPARGLGDPLGLDNASSEVAPGRATAQIRHILLLLRRVPPTFRALRSGRSR